MLNRSIEADVLPADGRAYGVEFAIKKNYGKFQGQIGYTFSRSFLSVKASFDQENINPRELALGYFGASAVVRSRITIRRDKLLVAFPQAPLAREGRCCEAIRGTSPIRPDWRN